MKVINAFSLVVCLCVCFLVTQTAWAQSGDVTANSYKVPIYLSDTPADTGILAIGIHPSATYGIDSLLVFSPGDTVRELELPPPGPNDFDVRLASIPHKDSLGSGSLASIHPFPPGTYMTQNERWEINFQPESDSGNAHPMKLWWPANIGSIGGGFWHLTDALGNLLCDMSAQSSFTMPNSDPNQQTVFIVEGDSLGFLTGTYDSMITTHNNAGKAMTIQKATPYNAEAAFTVTVPAGPVSWPNHYYHHLHLEFSEGILEFESLNPTPVSQTNLTPDGKVSKIDLTWPGPDTTLEPGLNVTFQVLGAKGKPITIKNYWWLHDTAKEKYTKIPGPAPTFSRVLLYEPDWVNVIAEVYGQGFPPGGNGIVLGITTPTKTLDPKKHTPYTRYVYNPKYTDFIKTIFVAGFSHDGGVAQTLFNTAGTKVVTKALKTYSPKFQANVFVGELATLKFNMAMSALSTKTNAGFGGLFYLDTANGSMFNGLTVQQIANYADSVFSGADSSARILHGADPSDTGGLVPLVAAIHKINGVFSGPLDTTSWSGLKVRLKSPRLLMNLNPQTLYRKTNSGATPSANPNWVFKGFIPEQFKLEQNYPNPFNPTTTIQFTMPADGFVTLKVYNILGQEVVTLYNHEPMTQGVAQAHFNGGNLASGVYFYRFVAETVGNGDQPGQTFTQVKKMMLIK